MSDISINNKTVKKVLVGDKVLYEKQSDPVTALPQPLPTTKKTLTMLSGTCDVNVTPYIKIRDAAGVSRSVEEWHARAVQNGFVTTGVAAPVGVDIEAWGRHFVYYFNNKYNEPAGAAKNYYDITGTTPITNGGLRHSQWQHTMDTFANPGTNPTTRTYTIGSTTVTATSTADGDNVILSTSNSPFIWRIKKGITTTGGFLKNLAKEYYDAQLAYTEWYRTLIAKDLGVVSAQQIADWHLLDGQGNAQMVDIFVLNAAGTGRPAATEDMYFFVKDYTNNQYVNLNTLSAGLLAKYNATGNSAASGIFGGDNLTSIIADDIYTEQKKNGVNMNDNAANIVGVENGKVILTEGCKGAQVYVHNTAAEGETPVYHLFLVTPVISRANNSTSGATPPLKSPEYNIPDSPALSWVKWFGEQNNLNVFMPDEQMLEAVWTNRNSCINSIITYLNKGAGVGENWGVRNFPSEYFWCSVRTNAYLAWNVNMSYGGANGNSVSNRYVGCAVSAL